MPPPESLLLSSHLPTFVDAAPPPRRSMCTTPALCPGRLKFSYRHVYRPSLCLEQPKCTATIVAYCQDTTTLFSIFLPPLRPFLVVATLHEQQEALVPVFVETLRFSSISWRPEARSFTRRIILESTYAFYICLLYVDITKTLFTSFVFYSTRIRDKSRDRFHKQSFSLFFCAILVCFMFV